MTASISKVMHAGHTSGLCLTALKESTRTRLRIGSFLRSLRKTSAAFAPDLKRNEQTRWPTSETRCLFYTTSPAKAMTPDVVTLSRTSSSDRVGIPPEIPGRVGRKTLSEPEARKVSSSSSENDAAKPRSLYAKKTTPLVTGLLRFSPRPPSGSEHGHQLVMKLPQTKRAAGPCDVGVVSSPVDECARAQENARRLFGWYHFRVYVDLDMLDAVS